MNTIDKIKIGSNNYHFRDTRIFDATTEVSGLARIATQLLVDAGSDSSRIVTPYTLSHWLDKAYGVIYDPNNSSPVCQKILMIGNRISYVDKFQDLFAHRFKRCVMDNLATRHINYYLDLFDSNKKADGTSACLTGEDGDVMVLIPITYWRVTEYLDGRIEYLVSDRYFIGSLIHPYFYVSPGGNTPRTQYVGAFHSCLCNSVGTPLDTSLSASEPSNFVEGYKARSVAGTKPWTNMNQATHRIASANNGGKGTNILFKQYILLMMLIEGGTFNTQNSISIGFTKSSNKAQYYKFTRLQGRCNFGNNTGEILADSVRDSLITWAAGIADSDKVIQFQYRGIENPYGALFLFLDGFVTTTIGYSWTADDTKYSDNFSKGYIKKEHQWPVNEAGYASSWDKYSFLPTAVLGSSSTYMTDWFYKTGGNHCCLHGGYISFAEKAGASCLYLHASLTAVGLLIGARLAC